MVIMVVVVVVLVTAVTAFQYIKQPDYPLSTL
jgi:hypothetical protein